jgi:hypothetical protein
MFLRLSFPTIAYVRHFEDLVWPRYSTGCNLTQRRQFCSGGLGACRALCQGGYNPRAMGNGGSFANKAPLWASGERECSGTQAV